MSNVVSSVISRATTGGNSIGNPITSTDLPIWYRIVRKGNVVTSFWSFDNNISWHPVGNVTLAGLTTNVLVGLAVSSGSTTLAEATFDNVQLIRPAVTIAATQNAVEYPPSNGTFTVTRTWDTTNTLIVSYAVGGTATAGADYTTLSGSVTIPAGQTSATITITPLNDATSEAPETIAVTLADTTGYILGAPPSATLTLAGLETPTETWQQSNFGANWTNDTIAGDSADPDYDGLNNLLERALNSNPNTAVTTPPVQRSVAGGKLTVTFTRVVANTDLIIGVFGADTPEGPWTELARSSAGAATVVIAPGATASESGAGATRNVEVRDLYLTTDPAHPRRFLKVVVTH